MCMTLAGTGVFKWFKTSIDLSHAVELTNSKHFPAWALAARIVFAISPNSASCERVFALLKRLFGDQQVSALAAYIVHSKL